LVSPHSGDNQRKKLAGLAGAEWTGLGVQVTLWQLNPEKSLIAKRSEMKGNSGHTSKANFGSDICEIAVDDAHC